MPGNKHELKILLIEDNKADYVSTRLMLAEAKQNHPESSPLFHLSWVDSLRSGLKKLEEEHYDAILEDLSLPDARGLDGFYSLRAIVPMTPILVLTSLDDETTAVRAVHAGAQDYLVKGQLSSNLLARAIRYAIERFQILESLEGARERAEQINRAKTEFLSTVSDELREEVTAILEKANLAFPAEPHHQLNGNHLNTIQTKVHGLLGILNDLHDFSKLDQGKIGIHEVPFELRAFLTDTSEVLTSLAEQKGIRFTYSLDRNLPNLYLGDKEQLQHILKKVIVSILALEEVSEVISLRVVADSQDQEMVSLQFIIQVAAEGLPIQTQEFIFECLAQAEISLAPKYGAKGLGLTVATKLISLLGGRMWIESNSATGTAVHLTVPLRLGYT